MSRNVCMEEDNDDGYCGWVPAEDCPRHGAVATPDEQFVPDSIEAVSFDLYQMVGAWKPGHTVSEDEETALLDFLADLFEGGFGDRLKKRDAAIIAVLQAAGEKEESNAES